MCRTWFWVSAVLVSNIQNCAASVESFFPEKKVEITKTSTGKQRGEDMRGRN